MAGATKPGGPPVVALEDVTVRLAGRDVLRSVSFRVEAGEFTGLIGSNGAGKTTLLRAILGLDTLAGGRITFEGGARSPRNSLIGYVPQKIDLDPDMPLRGRDLVGLGLDGHRFGLGRRSADQRRRIDEMLEAVDATSFADARVGQLSGGEQQRVLIAHALVSRPRLLLLDEPLANLDIRSEQEVVELVTRVAADHGVAVLISAHDMNPLLPVMDRVVYVASGQVASGTVDQVVTSEALSALYGHRVDVVHVNDRILVVAGRDTASHHHHHDHRS